VSTAAPSPGDRVPAGYRADWALFTDWCAATGTPLWPAAVDTVRAFLAGCPAAPATAARRVAAIGWHYRHSPTTSAAVNPPGHRELLGLPPAAPSRPPPDPATAAAAVRALPVSGWTGGFFGRRDAALLTVAATPLSWTALAKRRTGDVTVADGVLCLPGGFELGAAADPATCPPCVWLRWRRALGLAYREPSIRVLRAALDRATPLTSTSPHTCTAAAGSTPTDLDGPVFPRSTSTAIPTRAGLCRPPRWPGSPPGIWVGCRTPTGSSPRPSCDQSSRRNRPRSLLPRRRPCRAPRPCGLPTGRPWTSDGTTCGSWRRSTGFSTTLSGTRSTPTRG
jgi:hypothetical protein